MPVTASAVVEGLGDIHRVLAGQRVGHQQGFMRIDQRLDGGDFGHQLLVDMLAAGGVQNDGVIAADLGARHGALGDVERALARRRSASVAMPACSPSTRSCSMAAGRVVSSDAISTRFFSRVCSNRPSLALVVVLPEPCRPTIRIGRGRRADGQRGIFLAQGFDQHVMDDLDDLLARLHRADDVFADGARAHLGDEILHHRQGDVRLDQGGAHFAQGGIDIGFAEGAAAAKLVKDAGQAGLQTFKQTINSKQLRLIPTGFAPGGAPALPGVDPPRQAGDRKSLAFPESGGVLGPKL